MIAWSEAHLSIRDAVRRFVETEVKPRAAPGPSPSPAPTPSVDAYVLSGGETFSSSGVCVRPSGARCDFVPSRACDTRRVATARVCSDGSRAQVVRSATITRVAWLRHEVAANALHRVVGAFRTAEISCLPVKGIVTAGWLYADVSERPLSDVDLRIRPRDFRRALEVGRARGWELVVHTPRFFEAAFRFPEMDVEIEAPRSVRRGSRRFRSTISSHAPRAATIRPARRISSPRPTITPSSSRSTCSKISSTARRPGRSRISCESLPSTSSTPTRSRPARARVTPPTPSPQSQRGSRRPTTAADGRACVTRFRHAVDARCTTRSTTRSGSGTCRRSSRSRGLQRAVTARSVRSTAPRSPPPAGRGAASCDASTT